MRLMDASLPKETGRKGTSLRLVSLLRTEERIALCASLPALSPGRTGATVCRDYIPRVVGRGTYLRVGYTQGG